MDVVLGGLEVIGVSREVVLVALLVVTTFWDICTSSTSSSSPNPKEMSQKELTCCSLDSFGLLRLILLFSFLYSSSLGFDLFSFSQA
jgi:hypothetical protein